MKPDEVLYIIMIFFGIYIVLQFYIIYKMKVIIGKLFEILMHFEGILRVFKIPVKSKQVKTKKKCQSCKYRLAYYNSDEKFPGFLYYRCQITKKKVPPDYYCKDFVFDPQTFNV